MAFGISAGALVAGGIAAAGAVGGAMISANGAKSAANAQRQSAADANALQQYQYDTTRQDQVPWRTVGNNALNQLALRMGVGGYRGEAPAVQSMDEIRANMQKQYGGPAQTGQNGLYGVQMQWNGADSGNSINYVPLDLQGADPGTIEAAAQAEYQRQQQALSAWNAQGNADQSNPLYGSLLKNFTAQDFQTDPGYEFRKAEGMKGIENSAAARGGLLSGAALKAAGQYNQNFASNEYGNAFNRFNTNQTNQYNRLASLAGVGQTANNAVQTAGQNYANQAGANLMAAGNATAAGAQRASGYIGQGLGFAANQLSNNWGNFGGVSNNPYGNYQAQTAPVTDYYAGVNGTPLP
jgi:hypothetical protein